MRNKIVFISVVLAFFVFPLHVLAAKEFDVDAYNLSVDSKKSSGNFVQDLINEFNELVPMVYSFGINIISIIFLSSVLVYALATLTKNGQWMKWSIGTLTISFIVIMLLKITPVIMLTSDGYTFTLFVTDILNLLKSSATYFAIASLLIAIYFRCFYNMFKHPEYQRWYKGLAVASIFTFLLAGAASYVFIG